jgi:hypothetical protein
MEVKVHFVNQDDGGLGERVLALRIELEETTGEVNGPGDHGSIPETEIGELDPTVGRLHRNRRLQTAGFPDPEVCHIREEIQEDLADSLESPLGALIAPTRPGVVLDQQPLLSVYECDIVREQACSRILVTTAKRDRSHFASRPIGAAT